MDAAPTTKYIHPDHFAMLSPEDQALADKLSLLVRHWRITPHTTLELRKFDGAQNCYLLQHQRDSYGGKASEMELQEVAVVGFFENPVYNGNHLEEAKHAWIYGREHNKIGDLPLEELCTRAKKKHRADYSQPSDVKSFGTDESVKFGVHTLLAAVCAREYADLTNEERQALWEERFKRLLTTVKAFEKIISSESEEFCADAKCLRLPCKKEPLSICFACEYKKVVAYLQDECDRIFRPGINPDRVFFSNANLLPTTEKKRKECPSDFPYYN
tara:strand:+ start:8593 stop:9408 length:816 start_codon:yes stop_codon:yes gene_type:complete